MFLVHVAAFFLLVIGLPGYAQSELAILAELSSPVFSEANAIDAHGHFSFIGGSGIAVVDAWEPWKPKLLKTLQDDRLLGCKDIFAYVNSWGRKRLAVVCFESLVLVDVDNPETLSVIGSFISPDILRAGASVVVRGKLAFVAVSDLNYVVSFDITVETRPSMLSFVQLSGVLSVALYEYNKVLVTSGGRINRVTILSYTPSGVFMKVGSVKDGRLSGDVSVVQEFPLDPNLVVVVSSANGGTFAVVNTTTRTRPVLQGMIQSNGRGPAELSIDRPADGWNPNGHKQLEGAAGFCIAPSGIAYVFASRAESISAVTIRSSSTTPTIVHAVRDMRLNGVVDICSHDGHGHTRAKAAGEEQMLRERDVESKSAAVLYALNARLGRFLVVTDRNDGAEDYISSLAAEPRWEF